MADTSAQDGNRGFFRLVACVTLFAVLQAISTIGRIGGTTGAEWLSTVVQIAAGLFTAYQCAKAFRRTTGRLRRCWTFLGTGGLAWSGGQIVWALFGHPAGHQIGTSSLGDLPGGLFVACAALAFYSLGTLPTGNAARARALLDGITIGVALMFAVWISALHTSTDMASSSLSSRFAAFALPTEMVVLAALAISVFTSSRPKGRLSLPTMGLILGALVLFLASQSVYIATNNLHAIPGSFIDCGWTFGVAGFGLAAAWPKPIIRKSERRRSYYMVAQIFPGVAAAVVLGMVLERLNQQSQLDFISEWLAACVIVCVLVRQVVTSIEEQRLGTLLEARVVDRTEALSRREQQFRALVQHSSDVIVILREDGHFDYLSPSINYVLGHSVEALRDGSIADIVLPEDRPRVMALLAMATRRSGATMTAEWRVRRADGALRQVEVLVRNLVGEPAVGGIVLNLRDVTERKELEDQLTHQALHDDLTGLANRSLLRLRIEQALARWLFQNEPFCLVVVDLDDFKSINDSLGHVAGDVVLKTLAERIGSCTRRGDSIVRLGSDEFAVLLEGVAADDAEAHTIAKRIIAAVQQPMRVEGHELRLRASIGLACVTDQVSQADDIMRNADLALHTAKHSHRGTYVQFELSMHDSALRRVELEADLRRALENDELQLYYQPTMDIATGELEGVEALLRWPHPEKGFISPADFIPIAEESGLIVPIGTWVLRQACNEMAKWQGRYPTDRPLKMAVNLSGRQLDQPDVVSIVKQVMEQSAIAAGSLVLEMTESVLMENRRDTVIKMQQLVDLGCQLAIDDFGTGYSSLSYLRQFPIGILKIDRSFVMGLGPGAKSEEAALVQAIVDLARTLQLKTVAEGIETHEQLEELRRMGCDVGQGFLLARPAPAEDVRRIIEKSHAQGKPLVISTVNVDQPNT